MSGPKIIPFLVAFFGLLALSEAFSNSPAAVFRGRGSSVSAYHRRTSDDDTRLQMGLLEDMTEGFNTFKKRFTAKATASHILIKGGAEAQHKLEDLKAEIDGDYFKFAAAAKQYSECPSAKNGGSLGGKNCIRKRAAIASEECLAQFVRLAV